MLTQMQQVTLLRPTIGRDARGNDTETWPGTTYILPACSVQPGDGTETDSPQRDTAQVRYTVYCAGPMPVEPEYTDALQIEGRQYRIYGRPAAWTSPTGRTTHTVIRVIDWEG